ncbi:hypothetical protein FXO38_21651 [Capsicum annuum]|nr:hypothetical protein FXO38_21651 [Capsicum annuum]
MLDSGKLMQKLVAGILLPKLHQSVARIRSGTVGIRSGQNCQNLQMDPLESVIYERKAHQWERRLETAKQQLVLLSSLTAIGVLLVMAPADLGGDGGAVWHHSWHRHWWVIENDSSWQSHIDFFWDGMDGFCWWSSDEKEKRQSGQR